jgi:methyl-accepting chemotaxis protein
MFLELQEPTEVTRRKEDVASALLVFHKNLWPAVGILLAMIAIQATLMTHRIAGSLYRFRQVFKSAGQGDLSVRVRIRKTDYLQHEARVLEEMIEGLRTMISGVRDHSAQLSDAVESIRAAPQGGRAGPDDVRRLDESLKRLNASVEKFKV